MKRQDKYVDTKTFHFYNANPKNRITGDCVVRAISTALNQDYNQTYKELFDLSVKTGYMLNDKKCYSKYMSSKGWIKLPQPRKRDNTKYTGKEYCEMIQEYSFNYPGRLFIHIGGHHVAAIVEGRICDIWNSTGGCVGNVWIPTR